MNLVGYLRSTHHQMLLSPCHNAQTFPSSRVPCVYLSVTTGSSSFHHGQSIGLDTTRILFRLRQGPRTLKQYICEFLAIANYSTLPDCIIIEIFCDGVNEPLKARLRREGPRSSLAAFLDYALLCVGSFFTVGVAEEKHNISVMPAAQPARGMAAASEHAHAMAATAEPVRRMAAALMRAHKMAATVEPVHKMAAKTELRHVTAATPEPCKVAAVFPESSQVRAVVPESSKVKAVVPESSQVRAGLYEPSQVIADPHKPSQVTADLHESSQVIADLHEPSQVTTGLHKPSQVTAVLNEPGQITAVVSEPSHVSSVCPELSHVSSDRPVPRLSIQSQVTSRLTSQCLVTSRLSSHVLSIQSQVTSRLTAQCLVTSVYPEPSHVLSDCPVPHHVSSVYPEPSHVSSVCPEPPHVSSDRPEPRHVLSDIPRSRPIMMASVLDPPLVSVRAANISVAPAPHKPTINEVLPPAAALLLIAVAIWSHLLEPPKEVVSIHELTVSSAQESTPEISSVHESAPMPPEVAAPAAEPPKGGGVPVLSVMEATSELSPCHVTAQEANHELSAGHVIPKKAGPILPTRPATFEGTTSALLWGFLLSSALLWMSFVPLWVSSLLSALPAPPWLQAPQNLTWWTSAPVFRCLPLFHGPGPPVFHCLPLLHDPHSLTSQPPHPQARQASHGLLCCL
ncbi:CD209 antigen [Labeo rohita]|uniref:CD209 antigen n=1 Tax=Labeo rohita TaxID=84645 RepID=A0ABQ8LJK0_LABRO|nr:CD209 antigen [Labeo rohita]